MTDSYAYMLLKAIFSLAVVLALLGAFLYGLKAFMKRTGSRGAAFAKPVKVLGVYPLDYKKNLTVVDVAGEIIVLGVTPTSINLVAKIDNPAAMEELKLSGARTRAGLFGFLR